MLLRGRRIELGESGDRLSALVSLKPPVRGPRDDGHNESVKPDVRTKVPDPNDGKQPSSERFGHGSG
jgi:hypothetical protein